LKVDLTAGLEEQIHREDLEFLSNAVNVGNVGGAKFGDVRPLVGYSTYKPFALEFEKSLPH
jgi:hypothetical protein